jgi:cadmium resistance protein CadD (predicted permease)
MKLLALACFASPEFDQTTTNKICILLLVSFVPIFVVLALQGLAVLLGIFQITVLCLAEMTQWRFTRHAPLPLKLLSAACTYLVANLIFTVGVYLCPK